MTFKSYSLPFYLYLILLLLEVDRKQRDVAEQCNIYRPHSSLRL